MSELDAIPFEQRTMTIIRKKPIGKEIIELYCSACGTVCATYGRINEKILCKKTNSVYPTWRDKRLLDEEEKKKAKEFEGSIVNCRICNSEYKRRNNEVLCRECNPNAIHPMRFNIGQYTGVLVDENRKAKGLLVSKHLNTCQCGLTLKAKSNDLQLRWLVFCGSEIIEEVGI